MWDFIAPSLAVESMYSTLPVTFVSLMSILHPLVISGTAFPYLTRRVVGTGELAFTQAHCSNQLL
jgi:hypothetical protein